jgi:threonine/homoserine/homoserine lactone efflux protein
MHPDLDIRIGKKAMKLFRIFFTGILISFLGTLPLGTLNVAAMQISVTDGVRPAIYFSLGCMLVEIIYVRLSLVAMDWVRKQKAIFRWLQWITLLIIVALAVSSFIAATSKHATGNVILSDTLPRFWLGVAMSAINPVQIPFWFGWSAILYAKNVLKPRTDYYNSYIGGIGIGTLIGNAIFIFGGQLLVDRLNTNQKILHWVIGIIFTITALIQLWRMMRHKDAVQKL